MTKFWVYDEDRYLLEMYKEGIELKKIAIRLGRTFKSVEGRLYKTLVYFVPTRRPRWTDKEVQDLILKKGNKKRSKIAQRLKKSRLLN